MQDTAPDRNGHNGERPNETALPAAPAADLESALNAAMASERSLVAVWYVADGRLHLFREAKGFPLDDLRAAERLLHDDFLTLQS